MIGKSQINRKVILTLLILITAILANVIVANSQIVPSKPSETTVKDTRKIPDVEELASMLNKSLLDLQSLEDAKMAVDSELSTNKELLLKEQSYNEQLLKVVDLLVSSEKRDKGFFRRLAEQLGKVLKVATKPENMAIIAAIIVAVKSK